MSDNKDKNEPKGKISFGWVIAVWVFIVFIYKNKPDGFSTLGVIVFGVIANGILLYLFAKAEK